MSNRYIVRLKSQEVDSGEHIEHANKVPRTIENSIRKNKIISNAERNAKRRQNYNAQKRHERYIRDKMKGKTGWKNKQARTSNPYGNYTSLYYNPEKAREYYLRHRKLKRKAKVEKENKQQEQEQQEQLEEVKGGNGRSNGNSGNGGSGSGSGSGSGGGTDSIGGGVDRDAAEKKAIEEQIAKLQEESNLETEAQRQAAQQKIEELREKLQQELEKKQQEREKAVNTGTKEREELRKKAEEDVEKEKNDSRKDTEQELERLKKQKEEDLNPYQEKNAELRAQYDSLGKNADPKLKNRLARQIASNNNKISAANAKYTDSVFRTKTQHTKDLRDNITDIREKLNNAVATSSEKQQKTLSDISNSIRQLQQDNQKEIQNVQKALNEWVTNEKARVGKETARLRGVEYKDPRDRQQSVTNRVNEILGRSSGSSGSVSAIGSSRSGSSSSSGSVRSIGSSTSSGISGRLSRR